MPVFTVIGFYEETGERFAESYTADTAAAAESQALAENPEMTVAGVVLGDVQVVA